jgi:hypothetical protein
MNADALVFSEFGRREGAPLSKRSKLYPRERVVKCNRLRLFARATSESPAIWAQSSEAQTILVTPWQCC